MVLAPDATSTEEAQAQPEDDFKRGEAEMERGALMPALLAFDSAARGAVKARIHKKLEERFRSRLGRRDDQKDDSGKKEEKIIPLPASAASTLAPLGTSTASTSIEATTTKEMEQSGEKNTPENATSAKISRYETSTRNCCREDTC